MKVPPVRALLELARPLNCLIAAVATLAGYLLADGVAGWPHAWAPAALAALATALVTAAGNALNDAQDAALDRIAHPERPIPSGRATPAAARTLAAALGAAGVAVAGAAGGVPLALFAAGTVALLLLYEWRLKARGLAGNAAVAALTAATLPFGAAAAGGWPVPSVVWAAAAMAGLANLGREIAKDMEDQEADRGVRRTFPMQAGAKAAAGVAAACGAAAVAVSAAVLWELSFVGALGAAGLAAADGLIAWGCLALRRDPGRAQRTMRWGMAAAVAAFVAFGLGRT